MKSLSSDAGYRGPGFKSREVIGWSRWWTSCTRILLKVPSRGIFPCPFLLGVTAIRRAPIVLYSQSCLSFSNANLIENNRVAGSVL